jgi:hypothetical protein
MGILINQGKHVEEQQYKILDEKNIQARIIKLEANPKREYSLIVSMQLMNGSAVGKVVNDYVDYNPESKNAWRYRSLRKSAKVPYTKEESERIDIEKLLLNKVITVDLQPRTYEYQGETRTVQNVTYKESPEVAIAPVVEELTPEQFMEETKPVEKDTELVAPTTQVDETDWPF